jgi:rubredoxin
MIEIKKIPGGYSVDGFELKNGKCGCTSVIKCCYSWSKVKHTDENSIEFKAKTTSPETKKNFHWSYKAKKDNITLSVSVEDAEDKVIHSGYLPPSVHELQEKGWEILESSGDKKDGVIWRCAMCKWLYKEANEGTPFESLPDEWKCPVCGQRSFEIIG